MEIRGTIVDGNNKFEARAQKYASVFERHTGVDCLHPGTLNVKLTEHLAIWPDFMIPGAEVGEPDQDLLFERCSIKFHGASYAGFRVRPYHRPTGGGGNGDDHIELMAPTIDGADRRGEEIIIVFDREERGR